MPGAKNWVILVAAAATLAAVLGAFLLFGTFGQRQDSRADMRSGEIHATATGDAAGPADRSPSTTRDSGSHGSRSTALQPGDQDPSAPWLAPAKLQLEIVHRDTGAPVAGAEVWVWTAPPGSKLVQDFAVELRRGVLEARLVEAPARSDEGGRVELPSPARPFVVVAAANGLWGHAAFAENQSGAGRVLLAPEVVVRVQVVSANGDPVQGALVALRELRGRASFDLLTARTGGPLGMAELRHAGEFLPERIDPASGLVVALAGVFGRPESCALDASHVNGAIARLVLPATGACDVVLVDERGVQVDVPFVVDLRPADMAGSGRPGSPEERRATESLRAIGRAEFEAVELGHELAARLRREGSAIELSAQGPGPRAVGERAELRVRLEPEAVFLCGRVTDPTGGAARNREILARVESAEGGAAAPTAWVVRTGDDGGFALEVADAALLPAGARLAVSTSSGGGIGAASARRPLPPVLHAGANDVGSFDLGDSPVVVTGLVVDAAGTPIGDALVIPTMVGSTLVGSAGAAPAVAGEEHGAGAVRPLAPVASDAEGRFQVRAEACDLVSLRAEKAGLVGAQVSVRTPALGVRIVLDREGLLEGSVLLDPTMAASTVLIQARHEESDPEDHGPPEPEISGVLERDGRFRLRGLRAGAHTVRVVLASQAAELTRVPGVVVRAGETVRDARLDPLDLRGKQRILEIALTDERGRPIAGGRAASRPTGSADAPWRTATRAGAKLQIVSEQGPLDVVVAADGYLPADIVGLAESTTVALRPCARVRLELGRTTHAPAAPYSLGVELTPLETGRHALLLRPTRATFDASGAVLVPVAFVGEVRAQLFVTRQEGSVFAQETVREDVPRILNVAAHAEAQAFTIDVDPERLAAAVEAARSAQ